MTAGPVDVRFEVVGVKAALRDLGRLEPELKKALTKDLKDRLAPVRDAVRARVPDQAPLSGMNNNGRLGWSKKAKTGVKVATSGRDRRRGVLTVAAIVQANAAGAVFDMAGRRSNGKTEQGAAMIAGFNRYGAASRTLWPVVESHAQEIEDAVRGLVTAVEDGITRSLAR